MVFTACAPTETSARESTGPDPGAGEGATHQGRTLVLTDPQALICAEGVVWTPTVTAVTDDASALFTWTVERSRGENVADASWSGTTRVPRGDETTLTFPCDPEGHFDHYALTLTAGE